MGDAEIGPRANIGAGTITANYDGKHKHRTVVGADARISSNTVLVAPVEVGDGAYTGAGAVVNRDVPPGALAKGVPAEIDEGWAERRAARRRGRRLMDQVTTKRLMLFAGSGNPELSRGDRRAT